MGYFCHLIKQAPKKETKKLNFFWVAFFDAVNGMGMELDLAKYNTRVTSNDKNGTHTGAWVLVRAQGLDAVSLEFE